MSPSHNNRQIAKNTLMLYFRMLLVMGVSLYTSRIVLAQLGVTDYGIFNVVGGIVIMFSFLNGAMSQSTQRFLSFELGRNNYGELKKVFKTAITIHLVIATAIFLLAETIGLWFLNNIMTIPASQITSANWVFQCSVISYVLSILQVPYNAAIIAREHMQFYAYMGILDVLLRLGIAFSLIAFPYDKLRFYSILLLVVTIIIFITYKTFCKRHFKECEFGWLYDKNKFLEMGSYAGWSTFGSLAWIGKNQGVNILLNIFFGPTINAAYGVSNQINTAVNSFVQNFSTAVNPQIVKSFSAQEYANMQKLITYGAKVAFFLMLIIAFPILMTMGMILNIWLVKVPPYTETFATLVLINSLIESISYSMGTGIQATGNIKWYQILVGGAIICNLPISYIFLKLDFPPYVVFLVSIAISLLTISVRLLIMRTNIPLFSIRRFLSVVLLPLFLLSSICSGIYVLNIYLKISSILGFIPTIILCILLVGSLEIIIGFNRSERASISGIIKSKFRKYNGI